MNLEIGALVLTDDQRRRMQGGAMSDPETPYRAARRLAHRAGARVAIAVALCALLCAAAFLAVVAGPAMAFTGAPIIEAKPAVAIAGGFEMKGTVNPYGLETTYHFEYGTTTGYGTSLPVPDADVGSGQAGVPVSQTVTGVQPSTTYHYRLVANNSAGPMMTSDVSFTTPADVSSPPPTTEPVTEPKTPAGQGKGGPIRLKERKLKGHMILVTSTGMTLYSLSVEKKGKFVCTKSAECLVIWHPLLVPKGKTVKGPVKLGTVKRPEGGSQVTYRGRPLYTFVEDKKPGDAKGEGLKDVGTWHSVRVP
jgi:predicted lipoprotein with Yx(FWY)xxD motif